jgi:ComF family protein
MLKHVLLSSGWSAAKTRLDTLASFLYPAVCQLCGSERAAAAEGYVGANCAKHVRFIKEPICDRCGLPFGGEITASFECANCRETRLWFSHARSVVVANQLMLEIIHRYKYSRALWFEPFLGNLFANAGGPALRNQSWDAILPVPLHPAKRREREFNQAERLARHLGKAAGLPMEARALRRVKPTETQTRLNRAARADNVREAFQVAQPALVKGKRLVLVDDVFTTGATTNECARALHRAGAGAICVWTLARGTSN